MTQESTLISQIESTLGKAISPATLRLSSASDIFEAYVFSLLIEAAIMENARVSYRDVFGNIPTTFVFRTSPGYIFSRVRPYTHAVLAFQKVPPLEAHIGVRIVGKSGVLHECDVAVIDQAEAETCRQRRVPPRSSKVLIAVECKFYSTPVQLSLARAFIGLVSDLSTERTVFVTNTASESLEKLLSKRRKNWEHNVVPTSLVAVSRLRHQFQEAFKNYKAS